MILSKSCSICGSAGFECNHCHKLFFLCYPDIFKSKNVIMCPYCNKENDYQEEIIEAK